MQGNDKQIVEQAKQLALTIALFNKKFESLNLEITKNISEVSLQLSIENISNKTLIEELKEKVAYKDALLESAKNLNEFYLYVDDKFNEYSIEHNHPYSLETHTHDYSDINHTHDYVENSLFHSVISRIEDSVYNSHQYLNVLSTEILKDCDDKNKTFLYELEQLSKEYDKTTNLLAKKADELDTKIAANKSNTNKDINSLIEIVDGIKTNLVKKIGKSFDELDSKLEEQSEKFTKLIGDVADDIKELSDDTYSTLNKQSKDLLKLESKVDKKAEINHVHDYSPSNHEHKDLNKKLDKLENTDKNIYSKISELFSVLKLKANSDDILLKSELDSIRDQVIASIPPPVAGLNGKDAEEWEFKEHPTQRGILIFKKQSAKTWQYLNLNYLIPKIKQPIQPQSQQSTGYAGGGGGSSLSILKDDVLVSSDTMLNFTGSGVQSVTSNNGVTTVNIQGGSGGISDVGTGWAVYRDNQYTVTSPLIISASTVTHLPNNSGTVINNKLPNGVLKLYDNLSGKLKPANIGDYYIFTVRFKSNASVNGSYLDFGVDTLAPTGFIFRQSVSYIKGAGLENAFTFTCPGFVSTNFFNNGGKIMITPNNGNVEIYDIEYQIARVFAS